MGSWGQYGNASKGEALDVLGVAFLPGGRFSVGDGAYQRAAEG